MRFRRVRDRAANVNSQSKVAIGRPVTIRTDALGCWNGGVTGVFSP